MATLIIYYRRYVRCLEALQDQWKKNRKWRHSQTSGFVLAALARDPWLAAGERLEQTLDFIKQNGPHGVDGILLSEMSAANVINRDMFAHAQEVLDELGKINAASKEGMGIYFFDIGAALENMKKGVRGCRVPSGWWNQGLLDSLGIDASKVGFFGKLSDGLLSCAPDEFREALFGDPPRFGHAGAGFGPDHSAIMDRLLGEMDTDGRNGLCGMTEGGCVSVFQEIGASIGMVIGALVGKSSAGALAGGGLGKEVGEMVGGTICGMIYDDGESGEEQDGEEGEQGEEEVAEPEIEETPPEVPEPEIVEQPAPDEDPDEAGVAEDPDETETIYSPDDPGGTHAGERAIKAWTQSVGGMLKSGKTPWSGKGQPLPVNYVEGAGAGQWILPTFPVIMEARALADENLNRYINYGPDFPAKCDGKISDEAMAYLVKQGLIDKGLGGDKPTPVHREIP